MNAEIPSRLRWACRRGMLELDVLLGNFLEEAFLGLDQENKDLFIRLLTCEDQELFDWLTGKKQAADPALATMIEKIRHHAQNRH